MNFIPRLLISSAAVLLCSYLINGVYVSGIISAVLVALFLGFLNVILKPVLIFLTIPITILSFGLFLFVINALLVMMVDGIVSGFNVSGFWVALLFSLLLSIVTSLMEVIINYFKREP